MKRLFIAVVALTSTAAFAQGSPSAVNVQSNLLTANGQPQTQTTTPQSNSKPSTGSKIEGANGQPAEWHRVDSWSLLGQGWKQFDPRAGNN
jgi:hypothetical protein